MSTGVGLPEALERAAAALPELADVIRPANGDPFVLLDELPGPQAEALLRWMFENEPDDGVELALDWAEEPDEGLAPLVALQHGELAKTGRKALRRVLHRLRSAGVELPEAPRRETVSTLPPVEDGIDEAMVTALDPTGARLVYLAMPHPGSGARLFMVALDEERGVLEFEVYTAPRRDARRFLRDFQQRKKFAGVQVGSDSVRRLIARALEVHPPDKPLPRGFTEWRTRLSDVPEGATTPGEQARAALGTEGDAEAGVARVTAMVEEGELGPWIPRAEVLDETVKKLRELEESTVIVSGATRREQAEEILEQALADLYAEPSAARAALRLEESAFVLWKAGKEDDARACLHAAARFEGAPADNPVARAALNRLMRPVLESLDKEDAGAPGEEEPSLILQP